MIELRDTDTGEIIGSISEEQLQFLVDQLEEESEDDKNYWLNRATLDLFAERGADPELMSLLLGALGDRDDFEVEWS